MATPGAREFNCNRGGHVSDYWNNVKYITLPVKLVNGQWELLYGGGTGIREGAFAELRTALHNIDDEETRNRLTQTVTVPVLPMETPLLIALSVRDQALSRGRGRPENLQVADVPAGCTRFEQVTIGQPSPQTKSIDDRAGGLWIRQRGVDRTELVCSRVAMPKDFDPTEATSLNHACTLLSEKFETHRISHTRNVYQHVFYLEEVRVSGHRETRPQWRPLENLRRGVIADMEGRIVSEAWKQLEIQLGFRPIALDPVRRSKRKG